MQIERGRLLQGIEASLPFLQAQALQDDAAIQFPYVGFERLTALGLLTATVPVHLGGLGFGDGEDGAGDLLRLLMLLGEASLPIARLFEAHVNALQLIFRYGSASLAECCAADAAQNHIFALWVTDPAAGELALSATPSGFVLGGTKAFCSGAGVATRALVTAADGSGTRMLVVRLQPETRVLRSLVELAGMRAALTGSMDFSGMRVGAEDFIGGAGDYLKEPVFSAGAWRGSAAALGGFAALLKLHRLAVLQRGRQDDPHQRARFGQVLIAYETARLWMLRAARLACVEDDTPEAIVAYVNLARIAVEAACLDGMQLAQRSLGVAAFIAGSRMELLCRDLAAYLRQPAPDETLTNAAGFYFGAELPGA